MYDGIDKCPYSLHRPDRLGEGRGNRALANRAAHASISGSGPQPTLARTVLHAHTCTRAQSTACRVQPAACKQVCWNTAPCRHERLSVAAFSYKGRASPETKTGRAESVYRLASSKRFGNPGPEERGKCSVRLTGPCTKAARTVPTDTCRGWRRLAVCSALPCAGFVPDALSVLSPVMASSLQPHE